MRVGAIGPAVPGVRSGTYFPSRLLERRRRAEQALISMVATCRLLGAPTSRVEKLGEGCGHPARTTARRPRRSVAPQKAAPASLRRRPFRPAQTSHRPGQQDLNPRLRRPTIFPPKGRTLLRSRVAESGILPQGSTYSPPRDRPTGNFSRHFPEYSAPLESEHLVRIIIFKNHRTLTFNQEGHTPNTLGRTPQRQDPSWLKRRG
ncbi:transposase [Kitasatospora sp. NPDC007106]|uniref:transposase n=1 Tax=Kitasatospora sp. NPDC007106 TaxID=3156914 RepID=UPI0033FF8DAA